jgi:mono/diheme cytochrome c family protein
MQRRVSGGSSWITWILTGFAWTALARPSPAADPEIDADALRPGLITAYSAKVRTSAISVTRLEPTIALALKAGEAPHPRLPADNGKVRWEGHLNILRPGAYQFQATVAGKFQLTLNGKNILAVEPANGKSAVAREEIKLEAGVHALVAEFERTQKDARVELTWRSAHFREEPLSSAALGHAPTKAPAELAHDAEIDRGSFLAEERNCLACHKPAGDSPVLKGLVSRQGPDLSKVGERVFAGWIYHWLDNPQKVQPGAVMPRLFSDDETGSVERHAVASYLSSLGGPLKLPTPREGKKPENVAQGQRFFGSIGCLACHQDDSGKAKEDPYRLPRFLPLPATYPLANLGSKTTPDKLAAYLSNPLAVDPSGRMPHMLLQGHEAQELARFLCNRLDSSISRELPASPAAGTILSVFEQVEPRAEEKAAFEKLPLSGQLVDLGKRLVIEKGCNNCHTIAPGGKPFASVYAKATMDDLRKDAVSANGCLAPEAGTRGKAPRFGLSDKDRKSILRFVKEGATGAGTPAPAFAARATLERFNCLACHTRDGEGGLSADLVEELRKYEKAENSEAVTPPTLSGIGHKLHTSTLRQVLVNANRARPWMALRMPQFGEANVGKLPGAIASLEGIETDDQIHKVSLTVEKLEAGKKLIGKSGFGCISCHDLANVPNSGTRGPDLARTTERVRYDWYLRWLEQPQRMQTGTRMPSVFSGGKSLLDGVLGGHADAQAEAMWAYLSLGPGMPLPEGLEPPKGLILSVKDKPLLLRTFMPDAGARALAIGFPNGVSVAFDAATCRLAYGWSGNFLDAAPVWNDRGGAPAKVLGQRFWTAPAGCPWGVTYSNEPPDFARQASDPAHGAPLPEGKVFAGDRQLRFDGYSVDKVGLPTFRYRVNAADPEPVGISECPEPLRCGGGVGVSRRFSLELAAKQTPWLLAGESSREPRVHDSKGASVTVDLKAPMVELPADRIIVLPQENDKAVVLKLAAAPEGSRWQLRQQEKKWQVLLRLPTAKESGRVSAAINVWSLYRDEASLLKEVLSSK